MSRINDALKRSQAGQGAEVPAVSRQHLFESAWSVSEADPPDVGASQAGTQARSGFIRFSSEWRERLAAGPAADTSLAEQFRRLAATFHHAHQTNGLQDIMVTSATPGDGKTLTAVNLALVLAESYRYRVLLIDADLRRPSIPSIADLNGGSGLADALTAPAEQKLALVPVTARLTLLPAGRPVANSIEALTSPRMRQILDEARSRFDWVILDAPPVAPATDARLLAQMVGATLFVIHAGQTQYPEVRKAIDAIGREQIIGVVLNGVRDVDSSAYQYYGSQSKAGG